MEQPKAIPETTTEQTNTTAQPPRTARTTMESYLVTELREYVFEGGLIEGNTPIRA